MSRPRAAVSLHREMLRDLRVTALATVLALAFLVSGYLRAATVGQPGEAFTATSIATIGVVLGGLGAAVGPLRLRRRLRARRSALLGGFLDRAQAPARNAPPQAAAVSLLVGIPGGRYAHLPTCVMVAATDTVVFEAGVLPVGVEHCALCLGADR